MLQVFAIPQVLAILFTVLAMFATVATPTKAAPQPKPKPKAKATPKAAPTKARCVYCGKRITKASAVTAGHGKRCKAVQKQLGTPAKAQAHRVKLTLVGIPPGYIKTAQLHKHIVAIRANGKTLCTVAAMVRAFGTDKGLLPPTHGIAQFYYIAGSRARYISAWCATPTGLAAMASGQFGKAPKAPTFAHLQAVAGGAKPNYKVYTVKLLGQ